MSASKIYTDLDRLARRIAEHRSRQQTIVFGNGCFELLHVGHVRYLQEAKSLGDVLVVAVNTDESISMIKPDRRPVNPDAERLEIVAALAAVDYVVPLREENPESLIGLLQPDIHTKGSDYTLATVPERRVVESYGGRVEIVGGPKVRNTRDMLKELKNR